MSADTRMFAHRLLDIAREIEAEEERIKEALSHAADLRDMDRIRIILSRWRRGPVVEVLRGLEQPSETGDVVVPP